MQKCSRCEKQVPAPGAMNLKPVTTDLCPRCVDYFELREVADICQYIENLPAPILVVDGDGMVRGANTQACKAVSKDLPHIVNLRGGDVFECAHARLPGGCGRTVHCSGCTVRRAVLDTLSTGNPLSGISVEVLQNVKGKDRRVTFQISTQRLANCVLLQIDGGL
ncbi:MAG: hypothetical protein NTZ09_13520 [Candidatus Hydrogenedentes bacterium]|nr:hypothetical protein [Candidatus Hydrogenedentota bacterium]